MVSCPDIERGNISLILNENTWLQDRTRLTQHKKPLLQNPISNKGGTLKLPVSKLNLASNARFPQEVPRNQQYFPLKELVKDKESVPPVFEAGSKFCSITQIRTSPSSRSEAGGHSLL